MLSVRDDVRAAIEAFAAASKIAMARKDLDAMLSMMTDDVVLLTASGPPVVGREAVRELYSGMLKKTNVQNTASSSAFTIEAVGNVVVVAGKDSATINQVGVGPARMVRGLAISVFRCEGGNWKLARSLNLMAPVKES